MPINEDNNQATFQDTCFRCGNIHIHVVENKETMGAKTADIVVTELKNKAGRMPLVLWLMAAPSAFPFYKALIKRASVDSACCEVLRNTHFFQFDDYPIHRNSPQFPATFRYLLEKYLFQPLIKICGALPVLHPLELTGIPNDMEVQRQYRDDLLSLKEKGAYILQIKGTGMDGHWGFHGSETPLDQEPGMIVVPMNSQNIRQQMLDWPDLFPTVEDVPKQAVTFNVPMFMLADRIIDNTPQPEKEFAVLAAYGTDEIINDIPSSVLKRHACAETYLTRDAARTLIEFKNGRKNDQAYRLSPDTLQRLKSLWKDPCAPAAESKNIAIMESILRRLDML